MTKLCALLSMILTVSLAVLPAAATDHCDVCYPGDDASREAIAQWMGATAAAAGLPEELPVMAALTESGLQNSGGDADSLGYFQMRVGMWNHGEYEGFPSSPELQLKWFVDRARVERSIRIADPEPKPGTWGEWIADVERPEHVEPRRAGDYQRRLRPARTLLSAQR